MKVTQSCMCSVSKRSKLSDPPGKCCTETLRRSEEWRESESSERRSLGFGECPLLCAEGSSMEGVRAPFIRGFGGGEPETERVFSRGGEEDIGVVEDTGVERSLIVLEPLVAAIEGELGGSGERVK